MLDIRRNENMKLRRTARILNGGRDRQVPLLQETGFLSALKPRSFPRLLRHLGLGVTFWVGPLVECTHKCTGGVGVQWWSAGAAEIEVKQISPPSDRGRFLAHLGRKGGCLEYKVQLLDGRE